MTPLAANDSHHGRRQPACGVLATADGRTILFCTACTKNRAAWLTDGKVAKSLGIGPGKWQRCLCHHRIRTEEQYAEKREYLRQNPVRAGLVSPPDEWPWQGEIEPIEWR
jgi:hypothetical protein